MKLTALAATALFTLTHLVTGDPAASTAVASDVTCITCWPVPAVLA